MPSRVRAPCPFCHITIKLRGFHRHVRRRHDARVVNFSQRRGAVQCAVMGVRFWTMPTTDRSPTRAKGE